MAARRRALAAKALERARAASVLDPPRSRACPCACQSTLGAGSPGARAATPPWLGALPPSASAPLTATTTARPRGPKNGSWSNGRKASRNPPNTGSPPCRPRPQAGTWPRPLRGRRMAGLSPSRDALHRNLRIPHRRTGRFSPLRRVLAAIAQSTCPTQRLPTPRRSRSGLNATSQH